MFDEDGCSVRVSAPTSLTTLKGMLVTYRREDGGCHLRPALSVNSINGGQTSSRALSRHSILRRSCRGRRRPCAIAGKRHTDPNTAGPSKVLVEKDRGWEGPQVEGNERDGQQCCVRSLSWVRKIQGVPGCTHSWEP